jgi:hypothetical protein
MVNYQYTYLLIGFVFFVIWLFLFLWKKEIRKEILIISAIFGFAGPLADFFYTQDWWSPLTHM